MHFIFLRHAARADKEVHLSDENFRPDLINNDPSFWLAAYDPPLNSLIAAQQVQRAFKRVSSSIKSLKPEGTPSEIIIHSSPYNRCIQTSEYLASQIVASSSKLKHNLKLRVDQALADWLNEYYQLEFLPPNDGGSSLISNFNSYIESEQDTKFHCQSHNFRLKSIRDTGWLYNRLGRCGDYGESPDDFRSRCFSYLSMLTQFYQDSQSSDKGKNTVVFVVSHGAVISMFLQIITAKSLFSEIPLCTPIYLKRNDTKMTYSLVDYDFNLSSILGSLNEGELLPLLRTEFLLGASSGNYDQHGSWDVERSTAVYHSSQSQRKRSRTINIARTKSSEQLNGNLPLRQVKSSKHLQLLNKDTNQTKILDLNKLEGFLGVDSDSDDETLEGAYLRNDASARASSVNVSSLLSKKNVQQISNREEGACDKEFKAEACEKTDQSKYFLFDRDFEHGEVTSCSTSIREKLHTSTFDRVKTMSVDQSVFSKTRGETKLNFTNFAFPGGLNDTELDHYDLQKIPDHDIRSSRPLNYSVRDILFAQIEHVDKVDEEYSWLGENKDKPVSG
ncbi:hypothetical protein OGAPHI_007055 [Ogataea philodendri]|uniref:Uncharacterized protein n=1 Tax=Ogataea philodendri TaxID=1378263 RepID=A0A9P8SZU8_9ASCO|nr:uncharacterized protein OGAPHI_007055 [Ogataea philodendri]KAH3660469.1 hypothetical protein OGAPHI_007055 [Ogataea philodendri]